MNDFSVDQVVSLLPHAQQPVFAKLSGRLKEICVMRLSSFEPEIPTLALKILSTTSENKGWEDKERFLIHFLSQIYPETQKTLERVLKIAEQGFFNELNSQVDNKKKEALAVKKMIATIEEFETDTLPQLLQKKADNQLLVQHSTLPTSSSPLVKNYEKLMDCQVYFAFPQLVNEFLDLLPFNQKWKPTIYAYLFHLLNVPYNLHFNDFEKLKLCKTLFRLHHPLHPTKFEYCSEVDIREFIDSAFQLKEKEGEEPLVYYFASLDKNSDELNLNDMIRVLNLLLSAGKDGDLCKVIENWKKKKLRWGKLFEILETDLAQQGLNLSLLKEDVPALLARFKKDSTVIYPLSDQQLQQIQSHYQTVRQFCEKYHQLKFNQLMNRAHEIRSLAKQGAIDQVKRLELVAIGRLAIRLEFGIYPYHTQIFALLGILLDGKSRQAQVKTGEGKSTIVALWAFVMAMEGQGVDIVTSARYLAMRDHDKFARFFKRCGITSSHICYDHKRPEYFKAQILYAPAFDFEFAWMEDLLWGSNLYEQRKPYVARNFDVVCVDESDNLLIDGARNGARLAYPSDVDYHWVYSPLLSFVRLNKGKSKKDVSQLVSELRKFLSGVLTEQTGQQLQKLSDNQLHVWLESAYHALFELSEKKEYVVRKRQTEEGQSQRTIQIVNLRTGRISENSRWQDGIHEFLEVKHDIIVERENLTALSLSHAVFYRFYRMITALTGTAERFQTKEIYQIDSFDVPPHRELKRKDLPTLIAQTTNQFEQMVMKTINECTKCGRPLLILCHDIEKTEQLASDLKSKNMAAQLLNEIQEELEHVILAQAGNPGKITIATNTAGRGTDILLPQESLNKGGLHVLLTFYPDSQREQDQAIGRAGRQGQPGSSQMILNREDDQIQKLIEQAPSFLKGLHSDAALIQLLERHRQVKEKSESNLQIARAELERFLAEKTHQFYHSFRQWSDHVSQDILLEQFAEKLYSVKLRWKKDFDFSHLSSPDLVIAEECKRLLTTSSEKMSWKVFLKQVMERLKQKMINQWVKEFFEPSEKMLLEIGTHINQEKLELEALSKAEDSMLAFFTQGYLNILTGLIKQIKSQIDQGFGTHQKQSQTYLNLDGSGLFVYLEEITTIKLLSIIKN